MSRPKSHQVFALLACLLLATGITPMSAAHAAGSKLYKWVDEKGEVHYSDTVPAQEAGKQRDILNQQGMTVDKIKRAKTPEEIAAEEREARKKAALQKRIDAQEAHDRMLLTTYLTADDLIHARDAKLLGIQNIIRDSQTTLQRQHDGLENLMHQAANAERAGRKVPPALVKKIQEARDEIHATETFIQKRRADQDAIRKEYGAELDRYRKLKSGDIHPGQLPDEAPASGKTPSTPPATPKQP